MNTEALPANASPEFPPSTQEIRSRIIPEIGTASSADRSYIYNDPHTSRRFQIQAMADGSYFLYEMVPNGRRVECDADGVAKDGWDDPTVAAAKKSPNSFNATMTDAGIDMLSLVLTGAGGSIDSRYFPDLAACARAIRRALDANRYYRPYRRLSNQEVIALDRQSAADSRSFWEGRKATIERALEADSGLFRGCHNALGQPLSGKSKQAILSYLNSPSLEGWKEIRNLCLIGFTTPWQCWIKVDWAAPASGGSDLYPSADILRHAIRHTVDEHLAEATQRVAEAPHRSGLSVVK